MATTENFVISKKDKKVRPMNGNSYDYWIGKKRDTIIGEIAVFASFNHKEEAKKIVDLLKKNNMENDYFKIRIELK